MSLYPVLLDISGKACVVIGGGRVAERKVKGLLECEAAVRLVSPEVSAELAGLAWRGAIEWRRKSYSDEDLDGAFLVFAATSSPEVQEMICRRAGDNGQLVNVADDPDSCTFHVPATVRRGDLTLAVSTTGKSPAVAALIRKQLEKEFGPEYETLLQLMTQVRQRAGSGMENVSQPERKKIYKKILHNDIIDWIRTGQIDNLHDHLEKILGPDTVLEINLPKLDT
jgi:precorrin-2 dehydrogenase/sirohydrochlorin ferrochelatase